jgi:hypothetical protein
MLPYVGRMPTVDNAKMMLLLAIRATIIFAITVLLEDEKEGDITSEAKRMVLSALLWNVEQFGIAQSKS